MRVRLLKMMLYMAVNKISITFKRLAENARPARVIFQFHSKGTREGEMVC